MGSSSKEVQVAQKETAEQELNARLAVLSGRGVDEKAIKKDPVVRHLRADIKSLRKRLLTIDSVEARTKAQAERKAAKAAQPKDDKKKKKKAEPVAEQSKKSKKKEKKATAEKEE